MATEMRGDELHVMLGTGQVGLALMRELLKRGKRVRMVNRSGRLPGAEAAAEIVPGDVTDPNAVRDLARGAAVVYLSAQPSYHEWTRKFSPIVNGVLEGLRGMPTKLVFADNLYMYGPVKGPLTEDLPYEATGPKGGIRAELATSILQANARGDVRATIARASDFYGAYVVDSSAGERVFGSALAGKAVDVLGNPDNLHTYTYIDDFARGMVTLGENDKALGRAWHIPSAETITTRQFVELIGAELGRPVKMRVMAPWMISGLGLFMPTIRELKEVEYQFQEPFVMDHRAFAQAFGARTTPHAQAIRETLAWYRERVGQVRRGALQAA